MGKNECIFLSIMFICMTLIAISAMICGSGSEKIRNETNQKIESRQ